MNSKENEILKDFNINDLWLIIVNHIKFIIILSSSIFIFSSIYVFFISTPSYISSADVMVQVEQDSSSNNNQNYDLVNAFRLIDTVAELIGKEVILDNALIKLYEIGYSELEIDDFRSGISVNSSSTSYFINVSFIDKNPKFAEDAVNALIDSTIEVTDVADAFPVLTNKIRRTSFASEGSYYSPNKLLVSFISLILGLLLSTSIVFFKVILSSKFKSKEEIENNLNIQVIGVIPKMDIKEIKNGQKKK